MRKFRHVMKMMLASLGGCAALALPASTGHAADLPARIAPPPPVFGAPALSPFFIRVGVTGVFIDPGTVTAINGVVSPTGAATIATVPASYVEAGYFLTKSFAVSLSGGFPPVLTSTGAGGFAPLGTLYKTTVGLPIASVHYHADLGRLHPYIGGGVAYAIVFRNQAATILAPNLKGNAGVALVGGADFDLTDHWSLFVDVKKVWLKQNFKGNVAVLTPLGVAVVPVTGRVRSDPVLASLGIGYRF